MAEDVVDRLVEDAQGTAGEQEQRVALALLAGDMDAVGQGQQGDGAEDDVGRQLVPVRQLPVRTSSPHGASWITPPSNL